MRCRRKAQASRKVHSSPDQLADQLLGRVMLTNSRDYQAFVNLLPEASLRMPMRVLAYCLMPNHFHLVVWPSADGDLSRWMHWLRTAHVRRYQRHYHATGHVWQGRFKTFPIQDDDDLLVVLRYVELGRVRRAGDDAPSPGDVANAPTHRAVLLFFSPLRLVLPRADRYNDQKFTPDQESQRMRTAAVRSEIQRLIRQAPLRPFVLNLENGDRITIEHPENIAFDPDSDEREGSRLLRDLGPSSRVQHL